MNVFRRQPPRPHCALRATVTVAFALCAALAGELHAQEAPPPPAFPAPYVDALADPAVPVAPLRLQGIDLMQGGLPVTGPVPALDSMQTVQIVGHWLPNLPLQGRMPLTLKFWSRDGKITRTIDLQAGPLTPEAAWEPDRLYRQEYEFSLRPVADAFSGDSYLTLNFPSAQAGAPLRPLQALALKITPRVGARAVDTDRYAELFGAAWTSLEKSFRLGNHATVTLPIAIDAPQPVQGIGLVSAFSYGTLPQGTPVCTVLLRDADGAEQTLTIESGIATAKFDYDYHEPGVMNHEKVAIAESVEADYLSAEGAPFMKHKYVHVLPLPTPGAHPVTITFLSVSDVVFDIYDVVLVH